MYRTSGLSWHHQCTPAINPQTAADPVASSSHFHFRRGIKGIPLISYNRYFKLNSHDPESAPASIDIRPEAYAALLARVLNNHLSNQQHRYGPYWTPGYMSTSLAPDQGTLRMNVPVVVPVSRITKRRTINALQMGVKTPATYRTLKYFRRKFPLFTVYIRRYKFGFGVEV